MKKPIFISVLSLFLLPFVVGAHGGSASNFNELQAGSEMMEYIEEQSLGADLHAEMEALMEKMIDGTMTEEETGQIISFMKENPGPYNMMMNRIGMMNQSSSYGGFGHMFTGGGLSWLMGIWSVIWLAIGVLVILWLWKQVTKDNGKRSQKGK